MQICHELVWIHFFLNKIRSMVLLSSIKQQCKMWCSLARLLGRFIPGRMLWALLSSPTKNTCERTKNVQRKATKIIQVLKNKTFEERSKAWWLLWMRKNFKMLCEHFQRTVDKRFYLSPSKGRREGKGLKVKHKGFRLERGHTGWRGLSTIAKGYLVYF